MDAWSDRRIPTVLSCDVIGQQHRDQSVAPIHELSINADYGCCCAKFKRNWLRSESLTAYTQFGQSRCAGLWSSSTRLAQPGQLCRIHHGMPHSLCQTVAYLHHLITRVYERWHRLKTATLAIDCFYYRLSYKVATQINTRGAMLIAEFVS